MNSSVAEIDDFIRLQKEKLSRDRNGGFATPVNQNQSQNRYYDNGYDNRQTNFTNFNNYNNGFTNGYYTQSPVQQQPPPEQASPRLAAKQMHPSPSIYVPLNEQAPVQAHRITKQYKEDENNDGGSFFEKFGTYENKKEKLKQDLRNEYAQYKQTKGNNGANRRNPEVSSEFYATLPIKEHNSAKSKAQNERNREYNYVKEKLNYSDKANKVDWWKDHNSPDVKPYSKHASIENLSNVGRNNTNAPVRNQLTPDSRSRSQFDVIADRRLQLDTGPIPRQELENRPPFFDSLDQYRISSANSGDGIRQKSSYYNNRPPIPPPVAAPILDNFRVQPYSSDMRDPDRAKIEMMDKLDNRITYDIRDPSFNSPSLTALNSNTVDPYLTDILRRPPVGTNYSPIPPPARVQFNENVRYDEPQPRFNPDQYRRNTEPAYNQAPTSQNNRQPLSTRTNHHESNVFNFNAEDNSKSVKNAKVREYQEELERQVNEKRLKKQKEKEEQDRIDRKLEMESQSYNPFGRGGGGAPIKDRDGNIKADLSKLRFDYNELQNAPLDVQREAKLQQIQYDRNNPNVPNSSNISNNILTGGYPPNQIDTNRSKKDGEEGPSFARGGNGIFGEGKSEAQKKQGEKYKAELQRQIEEKRERERLEKEKIRQEEEREMKRFEEQQKRLQAELEEEERKKREKENAEKQKHDQNVEMLQKRKQAPKGRKFEPKTTSAENTEDPIRFSPPPQAPVQTDFRSNSPPIPALNKDKSKSKTNFDQNPESYDEIPVGQKSKKTKPLNKSISKDNKNVNNKVNNNKNQVPASADYFVTESRLNNDSPGLKPPPAVNDSLVIEYPNSSYKSKRNKPNGGAVQRTPSPNTALNGVPPKTPRQNNDPKLTSRITKPNNLNTRPPSVTSAVSSSEVIQQLQNLRKHLHNEQQQLENELNNNPVGKTSVGQLVDTHQKLLSVRTPPGSAGGSKPKNDIYTAAMHNEPVRVKREPSELLYGNNFMGGNEPKTYYRDNSILLQNSKAYNDDDLYLTTEIERRANERQYNKYNIINNNIRDPYSVRDEYDINALSVRNEQRLRKLRDLEGDNLSLADPNDVLNKFMNRNNRRPSVTTLQDDTWIKHPA